MPHFKITRALPYAPDDMYELVAKIDRYPSFLRWIKSLNAKARAPEDSGVEMMDADVTLGYSGLTETFSTRITCDRSSRRVDIKLIRGPLKRLDAIWTITPDTASGGAIIGFEMTYAFTNPILALMAKMNMDMAVNKVMTSFVGAAKTYYTPIPPSHISKDDKGKPSYV